MIEKFFDSDGPVFTVLDKIGQLIVVNFLFLLGCIPVVTGFTSAAALYYAVCKSIRHGQGSAAKEFLRSYRSNLSRGIAGTLFFGMVAATGVFLLKFGSMLFGMGSVILLLMGFAACLFGPVLSRFSLGLIPCVKLTALMVFRSPIELALLLLGTVLLIVLQYYILPMPMVLILPGAWTWASTYITERVLLRFIPAKEENDTAWYYEK